ncbi:MAG TPA: SsrA-binding protein SmpB [Firmicutes bacterium]|nr:SsrA-binding protein SmpB [Bacillota bacterium]
MPPRHDAASRQSPPRTPGSKEAPALKVVAENRRARHDYHIEDTVEAGLVLLGSEVKSLRIGGGSLQDSYAEIKDGEAFLVNAHIAPYRAATYFGHSDPRRRRKLLLHAREIRRLDGQVRQRGYTLIPLRLYFRGGKAKVELALARGKRLYDHRRSLAERDARREVERELAGGGRRKAKE